MSSQRQRATPPKHSMDLENAHNVDVSNSPQVVKTESTPAPSDDASPPTFQVDEDTALIESQRPSTSDRPFRAHGSIDAYRTIIRKLYVKENRTLDDVIEILQRDYGVQASKNMYKKKIRQWSLYKGSKDNEATLLDRERRKEESRRRSRTANRISKPTSETTSVVAYRGKIDRSVSKNEPGDDYASLSDSNQSSTGDSPPGAHTVASSLRRYSTPMSHASPVQGDQPSHHEDDVVELSLPTPPESTWGETGWFIPVAYDHYLSSSDSESHQPEWRPPTRVVSVVGSGISRAPAYPMTFQIPEEMFFSMRRFVTSRLEPRFSSVTVVQTMFGPKIRRQRLSTPHCIINFDVAMGSGFQARADGKVATYGAFFERAFRCVKDIILSNHYCTILAVLTFLCEAERRNMREMGKMLLRYVCGISYSLLGKDHPLSVWSRNLLALFETPRILVATVESLCDAVRDTLGADDDYNLIMRLSALDVLHHYIPEETAIERYEELLQHCLNSHFDNEFPFQATQTSFAEYLKQHGHYSRAESVVAYMPNSIDKSGSPIINRRLLQSLIALAESQGAQRKDEQAEQTWTFAKTKSTDLFGADDSDTIAILQNYAAFLKSRGREDEAAALEEDIERRMEPYMLRVEGTPDVSSPESEQRYPEAELIS